MTASSLETTLPARPTTAALLVRGLTGACGACGKRRGLRRRWFTMVEHCPACGFRFEREPGHFIGAVGMSTIVTFGLLAVTLGVGFAVTAPDIPVVALTGVGLAISLVVPVVIHPLARTLWVAVDLAMHPLEPGEAVDPRVRLAEEGPTQQG
ncbi:MAG: DUF983 domain-containing protein [Actinomyces sp.]|nr:MAG: DUF983 domain-containing protein [Actinomyces sp.]